MNKGIILEKRSPVTEVKEVAKPETNPTQTERSSQIREAVARSVREYGETLKKLAKED